MLNKFVQQSLRDKFRHLVTDKMCNLIRFICTWQKIIPDITKRLKKP